MIRVVLADHITDLTRHTKQGEERQISDEATLSLMGERKELQQVIRVEFCGYSVELDHETQRAIHADHNDPAILFDLEGKAVLQIFLYGLKPQGTQEPVCLILSSGKQMLVSVECVRAGGFDLHSKLHKDGDWVLEFQTSSATDIIYQYRESGIEHEERLTVAPGSHKIPVQPDFRERFAICLSPEKDPFGCMEIKHSIIGEVGAVSGRYLFSRGRLWTPPTRTLPAYQSVVLDLVTEEFAPSMIEAIPDASEVDMYTSVNDARAFDYYMRSSTEKRLKLTTVSTEFADEADLTLISPEQEIPSGWKGKVSTLLFSDQAKEDFVARSGRTVDRMEADAGFREKALEWLWCSAAANYQDKPRNASYGVSWSVSTMGEARGRVDLTKVMTFGDAQSRDWVRRIAAQPFCKKIGSAKTAQAAD